jgi:hypothetical protein
MKIIGLRMIFRRRRKVTGKSNIFAAEIHGRNGLILFHGDFSGGSAGGIPAGLLHFTQFQYPDI